MVENNPLLLDQINLFEVFLLEISLLESFHNYTEY